MVLERTDYSKKREDKYLNQDLFNKISQLKSLGNELIRLIDSIIANLKLNNIGEIVNTATEIKAFNSTFKANLVQVISLFNDTIKNLTEDMGESVKENNINKTRNIIAAQRILSVEKEFLTTIEKELAIIEKYSLEFSKDNYNYEQNIINAKEKKGAIIQLSMVRSLLYSLIIDKERDILNQTRQARKILIDYSS